MPGFDLGRYLGKWYEIARLDYRFERGLEQVSATYTQRRNGKVGVLNRGFNPGTGRWRKAVGRAVQTDVKNFLKVYFVPFFSGRYRVAWVDNDYLLAVVSGGTLSYLWLLARTPRITPAQRERMLEEAQRLGYDTSKLIWTVQV